MATRVMQSEARTAEAASASGGSHGLPSLNQLKSSLRGLAGAKAPAQVVPAAPRSGRRLWTILRVHVKFTMLLTRKREEMKLYGGSDEMQLNQTFASMKQMLEKHSVEGV